MNNSTQHGISLENGEILITLTASKAGVPTSFTVWNTSRKETIDKGKDHHDETDQSREHHNLTFEDGVYALVTKRKGKELLIAIGTKGMVGIYTIQRKDPGIQLEFTGSFIVPTGEDVAVTDIRFTTDGYGLALVTEDGLQRKISLKQKKRGLFQEVGNPLPVSRDLECK